MENKEKPFSKGSDKGAIEYQWGLKGAELDKTDDRVYRLRELDKELEAAGIVLSPEEALAFVNSVVYEEDTVGDRGTASFQFHGKSVQVWYVEGNRYLVMIDGKRISGETGRKVWDRFKMLVKRADSVREDGRTYVHQGNENDYLADDLLK